ncbi:MAG: LysR family transcriptional regulator [Porticoccaceae bacterium]
MDRFLLQLDLNLLKALYLLLDEKNVTRAADRMFVTQSAMSKTLRRLRESFNDALLVKTTHGLVPTPLAERLAQQLKILFGQMEQLSPQTFDPVECHDRIRIAATETFALGVLPFYILRLKELAPNLQIELLHLTDDYLDLLAAGTLDFAAYLDQSYPEGFISHPLYTTHPKIWCRAGHPLAGKKKLSLEDIRAYTKIAFHSPHLSHLELNNILNELEKEELGRDILLTTSHFLVAINVLANSDALMVAPEFLQRFPLLDLVSHSVSHIPLFDKLKVVNVGIIQHERTFNSPLHKWLMSQAHEIFAANVNAGDQPRP